MKEKVNQIINTINELKQEFEKFIALEYEIVKRYEDEINRMIAELGIDNDTKMVLFNFMDIGMYDAVLVNLKELT